MRTGIGYVISLSFGSPSAKSMWLIQADVCENLMRLFYKPRCASLLHNPLSYKYILVLSV